MIVYLESNDYSREVSEQVKRLLAEYQIVELRFPMGFEVNTQEVGEQTIRVLETRSDAQKIRNITSAESSEDLDAFLKTLVEMRDFLFSYASKVKIKTVPGSHVVVGEQIIIQGIDGTPIVPGSKEADDNVVIEVVEPWLQ